ncbi:DUF6894 family protein [Enterovirga aerilata]|uniref:DUF6894 domain-containing protein n=1 Tax=Enterovirga aerilata TaxID=2730920 RepID=A0A849I5Y0_9HYPH|nr:hypothetical protein [Enterovirga sp. DB1703]NNM72731.1 hypothetical protein [Enterovirga sp. DB1703]
MPRFFFDIRDGCRHTLDEEGTELADLQAACDEVLAVLPTIAGTEARSRGAREIVATVRSEGGAPLFRARLSVTTELIGAPDPAALGGS